MIAQSARLIAFPIIVSTILAGCPKSQTPPLPPPEPVQSTTTAATQKEGKPPQAGPITVKGVGLATPESILYDSAHDQYLVSNINGSPLAADNNGFISRVSPDGKVVALKWIEGGQREAVLNAPKGLAITKGQLFAADISVVRVFDLESGAPKRTIELPGATFVNDLVSAPDGTVYASDSGVKAGAAGFEPTGADAVWKLPVEGNPQALAKGKQLGRPNGLALDGGQLVVVTMGSGEMYRLSADGKPLQVKKAPAGGLDGIVTLPGGGFLVSSWAARTVYRVSKTGEFTELVSGLQSPADIGYDTKRQRLLVPLFELDELRFIPLSR